MTLKRIEARTILALSIEDTWRCLAGPFILVFDDGEEIATDHKETIYSRYFWEMHKAYPGLPLLARHHVQDVLAVRDRKENKTGVISGGSMKTNQKLLANVMWDCIDYLAQFTPLEKMQEMRSEVAKKAYFINNEHYNAMCSRNEQYVTSLDALDFLEVFDHPEVRKAYEEAKPDEQSIANIYSTIKFVLKNDPNLRNNNLSKMHRFSLANEKQLEQVIGPRGYSTEMNGDRFGTPVMRGYFQGLRSARDMYYESRTAAKALQASKGDLQRTEYFARKLRLMGMGIEWLYAGDCGSTRYVSWPVRGKTEINGRKEKSDLEMIVGMNYLDEETGQLRTIKSTDTHLLGKTIQMRNPIYCAHEDHNGVCETCFGQMSEMIPPNSNLGHACCTSVTEKNAQGVMSTKHSESSTTIEGVSVPPEYARYIRTSGDGNRYLFATELKAIAKAGDVYLQIPDEYAPSLSDVFNVDDARKLHDSRMSNLPDIELCFKNFTIRVPLADGKRDAYFTTEFLNHIRTVGFTVDEVGNYQIPLKGWSWTSQFASLPMRHFNMADHSRDIAKVLESTVKDIVERDRLIPPASVLVQLATLMNAKAKVNLSIISVTLRAAMIRSAERLDYAMPKPWTESGLGVMRPTITFRSLAPFMAYEHHADGVYEPASFVLRNRPDHPCDGILMPAEVLAYEESIGKF